jgi:hypothetical protein
LKQNIFNENEEFGLVQIPILVVILWVPLVPLTSFLRLLRQTCGTSSVVLQKTVIEVMLWLAGLAVVIVSPSPFSVLTALLVAVVIVSPSPFSVLTAFLVAFKVAAALRAFGKLRVAFLACEVLPVGFRNLNVATVVVVALRTVETNFSCFVNMTVAGLGALWCCLRKNFGLLEFNGGA